MWMCITVKNKLYCVYRDLLRPLFASQISAEEYDLFCVILFTYGL